MTTSPNHKPETPSTTPQTDFPPNHPAFSTDTIRWPLPEPTPSTQRPASQDPPGLLRNQLLNRRPRGPASGERPSPPPTRTPAPTRTIFQTTFPRLPLYSPHALRPHSEAPGRTPLPGGP